MTTCLFGPTSRHGNVAVAEVSGDTRPVSDEFARSTGSGSISATASGGHQASHRRNVPSSVWRSSISLMVQAVRYGSDRGGTTASTKQELSIRVESRTDGGQERTCARVSDHSDRRFEILGSLDRPRGVHLMWPV